VSSHPTLPDDLFCRRWVHVYEEDSHGRAIYRPEDADIPLSRRPRAGFELERDGTARLFVPGPGDRPEACSGRWTAEAGEIVVCTVGGAARGPELRIVECSSDRVVVRATTRPRDATSSTRRP
jgi:hypothetical protein